MEMTWKHRVYASLPYLLALLGAAGIAVTEEVWLAIVSLVGMWFLPSPLTNHFGTVNVSRETWDAVTGANVSRETLPDDNHASEAAVRGYYERTLDKESDLPVPCSVMHGSAEAHVLGCEGWTFPR